jgi:hypothetical protein
MKRKWKLQFVHFTFGITLEAGFLYLNFFTSNIGK